MLRTYYEYLGEQVYRRRGRAFWRLHRRRLTELGHPLRPRRLIAHAALRGVAAAARRLQQRL